MQARAFSRTVAALLIGSVAAFAEEVPQPLANPLPDAIPKGDLVVAVVPFVRAPKTVDPAKPAGTNDAYARIQYLMPIPDGSGRLAFNDLRGFLYVTDTSGRDPVVYLDLNARDVGFYNAAYPNETGLLGFAFHPQFADEGQPGYGKFYTAFTAVREFPRCAADTSSPTSLVAGYSPSRQTRCVRAIRCRSRSCG